MFVANLIYSIIDFDTINTLSHFSDIDNDVINTLYQLGIVNGEEKNGSIYFYPYKEITRAEVLALVSRAIDVRNLMKVTTKPTYNFDQTPYVEFPTTEKEFEDAILQIALSPKKERFIPYKDITFYEMSDKYKYYEVAESAFVNVFDKYPEIFTFSNSISANATGTSTESDLTIKLTSSYFSNKEVDSMRKTFFADVENIVYSLKLSGKITKDMTERQMARVFYEWIAVNKKYDVAFKDISYLAYGISENNEGSCQGYASMFNVMCKLVGIDVVGVSGFVDGVDHIWSKAILDGKQCYIDSTFSDPVPDKKGYCDFKYFDISEKELRKTHIF